MRLCHLAGMDVYYAGLLVPNLAFALGLGLFGQVVWTASRSEATVWRACALIAAFPSSFFFSMPYPESLGLLFVSGALLAWIRGRPALTSASLVPATLARQSATMFGVAVLVEWAAEWFGGGRPRRSAWIIFAVCVASFASFWLYLSIRYDDWLISTRVQSLWGRQSPHPFHVLTTLWLAFRNHTFDDLTLLVFLALGVYTWIRLGPFWGSMVLLPLALCASTGSVMSMKRHVLACFLVFYPLAESLSRRWSFLLVMAVFLVLQVIFLWRYVHVIWVA